MSESIQMWKKTDDKGVVYFTLRLPDGSFVNLHKNKLKSRSTHPDFVTLQDLAVSYERMIEMLNDDKGLKNDRKIGDKIKKIKFY